MAAGKLFSKKFRRFLTGIGPTLPVLGTVAAMLIAFQGTRAAPVEPSLQSVTAWEGAWTQVLARHVDHQGRVDFCGLMADRSELENVIHFIATMDPVSRPDLFSTDTARLSYYINAYNALAMYGVLQTGVPHDFGWAGRFRFFYLRKFKIGGRSISLYSLENDIIRPIGDPRVHFALNCMSVGCPRLPDYAFTADYIDQELDAAAREFVDEDRNVHVNTETATVRMSSIFSFYTDDFLRKAPSLTSYVNRYRTTPIPGDYKVGFTKYDWTINSQSCSTRCPREPRTE